MNGNNEANDRPTGPQPPFPVTELNGFYYFVRARGFSAAYHGQYARDFAAWADLPAVEDETPSEPSDVEFVALLRARERKNEQQRQAEKRRGGSAGRGDGKNFEYAG